MKKTLLVGALALFGAMNAQVKYGAKAGYNLSNLAVSTPASSVQVLLGNKSGYHIGGFVEYGLKNNFAIKGEVLYNNLGAAVSVDKSKLSSLASLEDVAGVTAEELGDFNKAQAKVAINQVSIPVSAKYSFDKFSVVGGFDVNFLVGVKTTASVNGTNVKSNIESNAGENVDKEIKKQLSSTNFGLHIGAEYDFTENFFADARYNFGISSLNKNFTDFVNLKQRYFQVGVGYKF